MDDELRPARLERETLGEQVARRVMDSIVARGLRPGDTLPSEFHLAELFGVSRPVIREGLRHLAALQVVELSHGRRPVIKPLSSDLLTTFFAWVVTVQPASLLQLHELRLGVECQAAALAAERRSEQDVSDLREIVYRMRRQLGDTDSYADLDVRLHLQIANASRNTMVQHLVASIRTPMSSVIRKGLELQATEPELEAMQARHERIVQAIAAGDAEAARHEMDEHISGSVRRLVAAGVGEVGRG